MNTLLTRSTFALFLLVGVAAGGDHVHRWRDTYKFASCTVVCRVTRCACGVVLDKLCYPTDSRPDNGPGCK